MPKVYKIKSQIDFISAEKPNLDKNRELSDLSPYRFMDAILVIKYFTYAYVLFPM